MSVIVKNTACTFCLMRLVVADDLSVACENGHDIPKDVNWSTKTGRLLQKVIEFVQPGQRAK